MDNPEYDCHADSVVGPLNMEIFQRFESSMSRDYAHMTFDETYRSYVLKNHGGVPKRQWFKAENGRAHRIGRFVNYGGPYSEPFQDSWENPGNDIRGAWDVGDLETIANICEGCGAFLIPFGLLYSGQHSPDESQTIYMNLVCFDYSDELLESPQVVVWNNGDACDEFYACSEAGLDSWSELRHDRFTQRVGANFEEFLLALRETESDLTC